ncbi:hypothetical protein Sjap_014318 [Stephania japonica]|uniref:Macro domain-containing protein n=1 Tax=Stephania japonica TaxID=461633 RepID=A0AAP0IZP1_9MAGN
MEGDHGIGRSSNGISTSAAAAAAVRVSSISNGGGGDDDRQLVQFVLSSSSALKIQKGDITKWSVDGASDAIVNAANERMLGGGGVDGAIHRAAGPELRAACVDVPEVRPGVRCPTGEARITPAFRLPVSHVVHTVGPIYDVDRHPEDLLRSAYRSCLTLAKENNILYIAFPAISCGVYGYPYAEAATVAISTVKEFAEDFKEVLSITLRSYGLFGWGIKLSKPGLRVMPLMLLVMNNGAIKESPSKLYSETDGLVDDPARLNS